MGVGSGQAKTSAKRRGISTVADVALALVLLAVATGVLVTAAGQSEQEHEPIEADHTAQTITTSTLDITYQQEAAIKEYYTEVNDELDPIDNVYEDTAYDVSDLQRVSHGPLAGHLTAIALTTVEFDGEQLSTEADEYHRVLDERFQTSLVETSFDTNVEAHWVPFEGASIRGTAEIGQTPPQYEDVSTTVIRYSSGLPSARENAIDAVDHDGDYEAVAEVVAEAIVEGYLSELESRRAIERTGMERDLVFYRYLRMAAVIDSAAPEEIEENLAVHDAVVAETNEYLVDALADQLEDDLESFGDAHKAADAVSVSEITITVRTWEQ